MLEAAPEAHDQGRLQTMCPILVGQTVSLRPVQPLYPSAGGQGQAEVLVVVEHAPVAGAGHVSALAFSAA
jgi:hypothetical protein